jgi:hypothetical protein
MASGVVEIETRGRGGSIAYIEGDHRVGFDWEFALPPAIALIFGPKARHWDTVVPWAAGRQAEIYDTVGAEVVRQQVPGGRFTADLAEGVLEILRPLRRRAVERASSGAGAAGSKPRRPRERSAALERFLASVVPVWKEWADGQRYDVAALARLRPGERAEAVAVLTGRDSTWREVEALAAIGTPAAREAIDAALQHHLSIDTRLAAAEARFAADPAFDLDGFLARQIRRLDRPANGLARALRLAEAHGGPATRQALLWASYNATECAPACARLLLRLTGVATEPLDPALERVLGKLGLHTSSFDRAAAFEALCRRVGMALDPDVAT